MLICQSVSHVASQLVSTLLRSVSHPVSYSVALSVSQAAIQFLITRNYRGLKGFIRVQGRHKRIQEVTIHIRRVTAG